MFKKIVELRPSISSENVGDHIIQHYISETMDEIFGEHLTVTMPTRSYLTDRNYRHFSTADYIFLCGTNLIASNMNKRRQWDLQRSDRKNMKNVIMLGVGWWQYQDKANAYTSRLLHSILRKDVLHSVRDNYTLKKFQKKKKSKVEPFQSKQKIITIIK